MPDRETVARPSRCAARLALALLLAAGPAGASVRCAPIDGAGRALALVDVEARIDFLRLHLRLGAARARWWAWTWAGVYSGLTTYNGVQLGRAGDAAARIDASVGTAASAVGVVALALLPRKVMADQRRFDRMLASAALLQGGGGDRCALLAEGERMLIRDAESERFGRGPLVHAGNFAINIGLGLLLGVGFGHWTQGAIVMLTGIAVGELQTMTSPSDVGESLARYRALGSGRAARADPAAPRWTLIADASPGRANLGVAGTF